MQIKDFMPVLLAEARMSKDPDRKICAVAFDSRLNRLASGWNGLPRKVMDYEVRYTDDKLKKLFIVHAEINLVASAANIGVSLDGSSVLITEMQPCATCAGALVQAGVKEIWFPESTSTTPILSKYWQDNFDIARIILCEAGVKLRSFKYEY